MANTSSMHQLCTEAPNVEHVGGVILAEDVADGRDRLDVLIGPNVHSITWRYVMQ